ncbi:MAG TPA: hypothetical protein DCM40_32625, partial [Maribacter sp.]|nr:hypothetical protein [Maribacter sp.]
WDNNVLPISTISSVASVATVPGGGGLPGQPIASGLARTQTTTLTGVEALADMAGTELATIGYATSLGGIMNVALDCLYEKDSNVHRQHVKNLNLRFVVGNIQIPDPHNENNALSINPLDIPIDVGFFLEWWNDTVVNKDLDFYPVGAFIRDLIERLINSVLFDTC